MDTSNISIVMNFPVSVVVDTPTFSSSRWPGALFAHLTWRALWVLRVSSEIILTGILWDTMFMGELINLHWPSTVTGSSSTAVEDHLWGQSDSWMGVFVHDIDSVGQG